MNLKENVVVQNIERTPKELVNKLGEFGVATISDSQGRGGLMLSYMRPMYNTHAFGTAVTVSIPPADNWMLPVALEQCKPGDILVVSPTSACHTACFGELLGISAKSRGVSALIMDAGIRDTKELTEMDFPIWSKFVSAESSVKETLGSVNIPINCAGVTVSPGDVIVADGDGVVVVKQSEAAAVASAAAKREEKEVEVRKRLAAGELALDISGMREKLKAKGLIYK